MFLSQVLKLVLESIKYICWTDYNRFNLFSDFPFLSFFTGIFMFSFIDTTQVCVCVCFEISATFLGLGKIKCKLLAPRDSRLYYYSLFSYNSRVRHSGAAWLGSTQPSRDTFLLFSALGLLGSLGVAREGKEREIPDQGVDCNALFLLQPCSGCTDSKRSWECGCPPGSCSGAIFRLLPCGQI